MTDDKYPPSSGRRRFVKGVVGSASLAGVATGSMGALDASTHAGTGGGGPTDYVGIPNVKGPAPRGMPIVPLELDDEGYLRGVWPDPERRELEDGRVVTVAETGIGGVTYSSRWFQYCGLQSAEGVRPQADQDGYLRSAVAAGYEWQREAKEPGEKLHVEDFADYREWDNGIGTPGVGKPAMATWRSVAEGDEGVRAIPVQVVRSERVASMAAGTVLAEFVEAATVADCVAWVNKCTHFCCVPGFKRSTDAAKFDAEDRVYCGCHQSVYDPFDAVALRYVALPRPEDR